MRYFFLLAFLFAQLFSKELSVLQPKNNTVFQEAFASYVINIKKESLVNKIIVQANTKKYEIYPLPNKFTYCKNIPLDIGVNKITVTLVTKKKKKRRISQTQEIFYNSEVFENGVNIPNKFKQNFFHTNKNEKKCASCHNMNTDEGKSSKRLSQINLTTIGVVNIDNISNVKILENPKDSNCFECHKSLISRSNSHAPSVNFACTQCHTGETNALNKQLKKPSKFLAPDPIDIKCTNCHDKIEKKWYKKDSQHGPVMTGRCTKCHNPHSSNNEFFLRKPIWKLCTTCHAEKAKGKHVLNSFVFSRNKGAHPTQGRPDPARPGRELVCSGCHNPHGSDGIYLLRTRGKTSYSVCKRCHEK